MTQVVAITGAASGIGLAAARLYAERGFQVIAVDVDEEALAKAGTLDGVTTLHGDVASEATNEEFAALALERFGRLDAVVLNAGTGGAGPLDSPGALERFDRILAVNLRAVALGIRASLPAFRALGEGSVVVTSSVSGLGGDPATWAYNASKAGVINLVQGLALDYAVENIRINAIAPGGALTALTASVLAHPELGAAVTRRIPLQRWSDPREQAEAIWFLTSPAASYITGATIPVDGGLSANNGIMLPPAFAGDTPH
ncbi:MAG: meso-butanediol dehydrogenase / (S,S)-butanediol dehydrogenase / diacetyl reductase [Streptosporangiaceae bacterium]|jgi:NAD(P)-dependent dehydrogenase (short-subunit alcohol dehydrogenase family)|nr:putative ketoreductase, short chain dehydrogenase/reductase family [Streptosporangiaceae bacterium]MDX6431640.1 meso-butanediol dehydrogenase / (S,S)-butanediol dehydrogenase / diacetyl reductase [Streptosporangiaceae bacterium]